MSAASLFLYRNHCQSAGYRQTRGLGRGGTRLFLTTSDRRGAAWVRDEEGSHEAVASRFRSHRRPGSLLIRWSSWRRFCSGGCSFWRRAAQAPGDDVTTSTGNGVTTSTTGSTSHDDVLLAASDLSRVSASAPRADVLSASGAVDAFGADLYAVLAKAAGNGNLVFSPASIETALAMTYAGAGGPDGRRDGRRPSTSRSRATPCTRPSTRSTPSSNRGAGRARTLRARTRACWSRRPTACGPRRT